MPSVLPLLLLAAAGAASLKKPLFEYAAAAAALIPLGLASALYAASQPEERWDALSHWLDGHVRPGEEVWLMPNELSLPLGYARSGAPFGVPVEQLPAPFPAGDHPGPRYSGTLAVPGMTGADAAQAGRGRRGAPRAGSVGDHPLLGPVRPRRFAPAPAGSAPSDGACATPASRRW